jgi:hypothetical protein
VAVAAIGTICALLVAAFIWRVEVRHSATYGFSLTKDPTRGIAVPGGYVTANYPDFNRLDIDFRAYSDSPRYDLIVHVRPAHPDAQDVRTIRLGIDGKQVFNAKDAFANPFVTVRFDPIADSADQTYYIWVERGPRNQDDVITVWSIKSYSRVSSRTVMSAIFRRVGPSWRLNWMSTLLAAASVAIAVGFALGMAALVFVGSSAQLPVISSSTIRWQEHSADDIQ